MSSGRFKGLQVEHWGCEDAEETFGVQFGSWYHIFGDNLPNDPTWLAANITDLLESET